MRLAVPDLVSNSYFPAIAAVTLGHFRDEGLDVELELRFPVTDAAAALRNGEIDFLAGAAHAPFHVDPAGRELRLLAALAQRMYWFLVVRADLDPFPDRTRLDLLRGRRVGAAPGPDLGLRGLLAEAGVDPGEAGVEIAPVPGAAGDVSFGVTAARALADGRIDAFWANGMGAEVAVREGVGRVVVDARRDGGRPGGFTFPALMASARLVGERPEEAAAATRAVVRAQQVLREDPARATAVGRALFPAMEAELIAELVTRDLPYYRAEIDEPAVTGLIDFVRRAGLTAEGLDPAALVPEAARAAWRLG
ncbi:ABC-type nitrate/sulfonate/bicarbonate transport system, substrate-binding protein [Streptomyces zhaozhouensis]|uniref:ABC-type nitrate/sulfonate/bicarbonate transport system, substrate-binding protein n=1 Tax=Streptomyces zhaozhouensis TaxID=1300267 RepID=A0A286DP40_9ACTN|nr:ABC transporter substrate-binding protein [Streptomyces zhaozhouensis]SOD60401.1 ABC-type nitrate/sulfonate/bicarbonate transport system, substrate-binding protein [Streptomyces zhaozhouensis]